MIIIKRILAFALSVIVLAALIPAVIGIVSSGGADWPAVLFGDSFFTVGLLSALALSGLAVLSVGRITNRTSGR